MPEYTWDMNGYSSKYGFYAGENEIGQVCIIPV